MSLPAHDTPINPQLLRIQSWLLHRNKKPFYANGRPRSGTLDSPRDLSKLVAYDAAVAALSDKYTGLGIAINGGLQFIDLDKCRELSTGNVLGWVAPVLRTAIEMGAFVEVSISGTGFHIVGFGESTPTFKEKHVEFYCHGRYMALGCEVLATGLDPMPDLSPLVDMLEVRTMRAKPALQLVKAAPKAWTVEKAEAQLLLRRLNPDMDYPEWIKVGMALHHASAGNASGLELWDAWSRGGEKYVEGDCAAKWRGLKADGGVTMGTLVHMAAQVPNDSVSNLGKVLRGEAPKPAPQPKQETFSSPITSTRRRRASHAELMATVHAPTPWAVEGIIAPGVTLLAAPPKTGKSYFVLQMALCVGDGQPFLGRPTIKQRVTYFNLEEWEELLQPRVIAVCKGNGIVNPDVQYVFDMDKVDNETFLDECQREINDGSTLLIIDLLARVRDELREDAKQNAYARDYNAIKAIADFVLQRNPGVCIVIVHHTNKGNHDDWQNKISGSQGLAGATHTNMVMYTIDQRGLDTETKEKLKDYRKLGLTGKLVPQQDVMLKKMPNGGGWSETDETEEDVKLYGKHAEILQVLREANGRWMTAKEVKESVAGTLDSIKKMLTRMAHKGEILSQGTGHPGYRIKT
jgi:hypothetical protein